MNSANKPHGTLTGDVCFAAINVALNFGVTLKIFVQVSREQTFQHIHRVYKIARELARESNQFIVTIYQLEKGGDYKATKRYFLLFLTISIFDLNAQNSSPQRRYNVTYGHAQKN